MERLARTKEWLESCSVLTTAHGKLLPVGQAAPSGPAMAGAITKLKPGVITQWAAVGLTVEPKVLVLVRAHFLAHFPHLERVQGALRDPPGSLELAALVGTRADVVRLRPELDLHHVRDFGVRRRVRAVLPLVAHLG